jgi:hypothetical protein
MEVWMSENPNEFTVRMDGKLQWSQDNWVYSPFGGHGHTWDLGNMIGESGVFRFDDVYFDHTRARIELADASRLEDATRREVQLPNRWGECSITVTVEAGAFAPGTDLYLFVIDENGNASATGMPVTLGDSFPAGVPADMDWDEDVDFDDVNDFALGLRDPGAYAARFCAPSWLKGDMDGDRDHDFDDTPGFVGILTASATDGPQHVIPEPSAGVLACLGLAALLACCDPCRRRTPRSIVRGRFGAQPPLRTGARKSMLRSCP